LEKLLRRDIGLEFLTEALLAFLKTGTIIACSHNNSNNNNNNNNNNAFSGDTLLKYMKDV
jgi:hypothetical protein